MSDGNIHDLSWAEADAAWKEIKRSIREEAAAEREASELIIRRRAHLLVELVDQRIDRRDVRRPVFTFGKLTHVLRYLQHLFARTSRNPLQNPNHRQDHQAPGLVIESELALAIFDHRHPLFQRGLHTSSSSPVDGLNPDASGADSHRLSGDAK